jgi:hypothetical protein
LSFVVAFLVVAASDATPMLGHRDFGVRWRRALVPLAERELTRIKLDWTPLRLLAEDLASQPRDLLLEIIIVRSEALAPGRDLFEGHEQSNDVIVLQRCGLLVVRHEHFLSHRASFAKHNSIKNQTKCLLAERLLRFTRRQMKTSLFEPLREQAVARPVPHDQLHVVRAPVEEDEQCSRQWILTEQTLNETNQPVERLPHVDRLAVRENPLRLRGQKHGLPSELQHGAIRKPEAKRPTSRGFARRRLGQLARGNKLDEPSVNRRSNARPPTAKAVFGDALFTTECGDTHAARLEPLHDLSPLLLVSPHAAHTLDHDSLLVHDTAPVDPAHGYSYTKRKARGRTPLRDRLRRFSAVDGPVPGAIHYIPSSPADPLPAPS